MKSWPVARWRSRHGGGYEVIPREAALKIQERDPQRVVQLNIRTEEPDADDPYAAYQVPTT